MLEWGQLNANVSDYSVKTGTRVAKLVSFIESLKKLQKSSSHRQDTQITDLEVLYLPLHSVSLARPPPSPFSLPLLHSLPSLSLSFSPASLSSSSPGPSVFTPRHSLILSCPTLALPQGLLSQRTRHIGTALFGVGGGGGEQGGWSEGE